MGYEIVEFVYGTLVLVSIAFALYSTFQGTPVESPDRPLVSQPSEPIGGALIFCDLPRVVSNRVDCLAEGAKQSWRDQPV
jgi:hypothetical protein